MELQLDNIGKRYGKQWIFKDLSLNIINTQPLAIQGPNGSGKSTLLKIISGFLTPSKGQILFNKKPEDYSRKLNFAAPYVCLLYTSPSPRDA